MNKPIAVLDTNIYISATFWSGKPYLVIQKAVNQEIITFISQSIIAELRRVLSRDFSIQKEDIDDVIESVLFFTHSIKPKEAVSVIKEDPSDNRILECALACKAEFIVTHDKHLLKLKKYKGIKIITAKEFLDRLDGCN